MRWLLAVLPFVAFTAQAAERNEAAETRLESPSVASKPAPRRASPSLALFEVHRRAGRLAQAQQVLDELDKALKPLDASRSDLASAYERIEQTASALDVWERYARNGGRLTQDQRMKMARLYEALGHKEQALRTWQLVWGQSIPQAQRSIVEDRIMALADELGRLGELAIALETRHRAGRADANDSSLLVRIYVKARQPRSAVEAIEEFFGRRGADRIEILKEQAKIYRLLDDGPAFERTSLELVKLDPEGRSEYLRGLILDQLGRESPDRISKVRALLAQLRESEGQDANAEFEAGVLSLAGFYGEAAESYRRAAALDPQTPDNYLLLGDTLKKEQRTDEAIALFQHLAQYADGEFLETAAVDGLLNSLAAGEYNTAGKQERALLRWAERMVLERLALIGDDQHYYPLLADLFDASQEAQRSFYAIENLLPLAGGLRSTTLRELITLSTPSGDMETMKTYGMFKDAAERRVAYSRRLIALGEALPPEVYVNLGKAFLARSDTTSASRAFNLAVDITGRGDLLSGIAEFYDDAGFDEPALAQYRVALVADRGNIEIMLRLARLLERMDRRDEANALYAQAMQAILVRQPARVQAAAPAQASSTLPATAANNPVSGKLTREYTTYYEPTLQGLLSTWPKDESAARARLGEFQRLFDQELARVTAAGEKSMRPLLRLDRMGNVVKYLAYATGRWQAAEAIDEKQRQGFEADPDFIPYNAAESEMWGRAQRRDLPTRAAGKSAFDEALEEAERTHFYEPLINLALVSNDSSRVLEAARAWARNAPLDAVAWADRGRLDPARFRSLCWYAAEILRRGGNMMLLSMTEQQAAVVGRLEDVIGEPVLTSAQIVAQFGKLSDENLFPALRAWRMMLRAPLAPEVARQLPDIIFTALERSYSASVAPLTLAAQLVEPRMAPQNVEPVAQLYRRWSERAKLKTDLLLPAALLAQGRTGDALDAYIELLRQAQRTAASGNAPLTANLLDPLRASFQPKYQKELLARLDALEAKEGFMSELTQLRFVIADIPPDEAIALLEKALQAAPNDTALLARLQGFYQMNADQPRATAVLERLHRIDPTDPIYRVYLYASYLNGDRPLEALKLNESSPEDMSNPNFFDTFLMGPAFGNKTAGLIQPPMPGNTLGRVPSGMQLATERLLKSIAASDVEGVRKGLRRTWQEALPFDQESNPFAADQHPALFFLSAAVPSEASDKPYARNPLSWFDTLSGATRASNTVMNAALEYPFIVAELEDDLRSMPVAVEPAMQPLYDALARAYLRYGVLEQKFAALDAQVKAGHAVARDISLWLTLLASRQVKPGPAEIEVLDRISAEEGKLTPNRLSLVAQVYAVAGASQRAVEAYRLKAVRYLVRNPNREGFLQAGMVGNVPTDALSLMTEAAAHLDAASQARLFRDIVRIVEPAPLASAEEKQAFENFRVAAGDVAFPDEPQPDWPPTNLIALADRALGEGEVNRAARALELALQKTSQEQMGIEIVPRPSTEGLSNYIFMLGISASYDIDNAIMAFGVRAPLPSLQKLANIVMQWQGRQGMDADRCLTLEAALVYRMRRFGSVDVDSFWAQLSSELEQPAHFDRASTEFVLDVANGIGRRLALRAEQALMASGRLSISDYAAVVERTAKEEGVAKALPLGDAAALFTQDDALLAVLADLTHQVGDEAAADHWSNERLAAAQARALLGTQ